MNPQALLLKMRQQRRRRVDLGDGKVVVIQRPTDLEIWRDLVKTAETDGKAVVQLSIDTDKAYLYTVDWSGITESDLIGSDGSSDEVPFDQSLAQEFLACHPDQLLKIVNSIYESVNEIFAKKEEVEKN